VPLPLPSLKKIKEGREEGRKEERKNKRKNKRKKRKDAWYNLSLFVVVEA